MAQFIISLIVLILSAISLAAVVALWVYSDAKKRSNDAWIWVLLTFIIFPVGLIIYLAVGRTQASEEAPPRKGKFVIPAVALAILLVVSCGAMVHSIVIGSLAGYGSVNTGSYVMSRNWYSNGRWNFDARSANGRTSRTPMLTAEELDSFFVSSANDGGEMNLTISQGDVTVTIDLTGDFRGNIDMSRFSPGRVRLQLNFDRASGIGTTIQWR
jgi:hypothetical protein